MGGILKSVDLIKFYNDLSVLKDIEGNFLLLIIINSIKLIIIIYVTFRLYKFSKVVNKLTLDTFLSKNNGISFNITGRTLIYYGLIRLVLSWFEISPLLNAYKEFIDTNYKEVFQSVILLLITGLFLLIISKLITKGFQIKQENDLTI
jgi:hypothetical protein